MPVRRLIIGTGITKQEVISISPKSDEDRELLEQMHRESIRRGTDPELTLAETEAQAMATLRAANLPARGMYDRNADGTWRKVSADELWADGDKDPEPGVLLVNGSRYRDPVRVVEEAGFSFDSLEGYAVRFIGLIDSVRYLLDQARDPKYSIENRGRCADRAVLKAMQLGALVEQAKIKGKWEAHALQGLKFLPGKKIGALAKMIDQAFTEVGANANWKQVQEYVRQHRPDLLEEISNHSFQSKVSARRPNKRHKKNREK
jgi:hypothetical protein